MDSEAEMKELITRFKGRTCKKLPKDASAKEVKTVARIKKEMKEYMRRSYTMDKPRILANQSVHSEYYGETPAEQHIRMTEKNS